MSFVSFAKDTIDRMRPLAKKQDGHGNLRPDWAGALDVRTITGCSVQPGASDEQLINRTSNLTRWTVYAPVGADVEAGDRITWRGDIYEVDGEAQDWFSPTGALSHRMFLIYRWEG